MLGIFQESYKPVGSGGVKEEWRSEKESEVLDKRDFQHLESTTLAFTRSVVLRLNEIKIHYNILERKNMSQN